MSAPASSGIRYVFRAWEKLRVVLFLLGTLLAMGLTAGTVYGMAWARLQ